MATVLFADLRGFRSTTVPWSVQSTFCVSYNSVELHNSWVNNLSSESGSRFVTDFFCIAETNGGPRDQTFLEAESQQHSIIYILKVWTVPLLAFDWYCSRSTVGKKRTKGRRNTRIDFQFRKTVLKFELFDIHACIGNRHTSPFLCI